MFALGGIYDLLRMSWVVRTPYMTYPDIEEQKDEDGDEYSDYSIHDVCSFRVDQIKTGLKIIYFYNV
jgi:hypothetical protein